MTRRAAARATWPVDHSDAIEAMGGELRRRCAQAGCRRSPMAGSSAPRAFSRSRAISMRPSRRSRLRGPPPDFLSHSHGEGFLRFFEERCQRQGIFIFDEPESALSPSRQIEFLKLLQLMDGSGRCQVIMATHSPMLMAYPNATLAAADEIRARAGHGRADRSLQGAARVLRRSAGVRGGGDRGVTDAARRSSLTRTFIFSRRGLRPSSADFVTLFETEGAGKAGCWPHPWPPCVKKCTGQEPQVRPEHPAFPARWFTAYTRSPR